MAVLEKEIGKLETSKATDVIPVGGDPLKGVSERECVAFVMRGEVVRKGEGQHPAKN